MPKKGGWESSGFASRLKELREAAGLSQGQLAEKAGCHRFTVAKLEQGRQEPAWPLVLAIADALGVDCNAFTEPPDATPAKRGRPKKEKAEGKGRKKG
jgi:DNA-binding XRE family transcriptional regulator